MAFENSMNILQKSNSKIKIPLLSTFEAPHQSEEKPGHHHVRRPSVCQEGEGERAGGVAAGAAHRNHPLPEATPLVRLLEETTRKSASALILVGRGISPIMSYFINAFQLTLTTTMLLKSFKVDDELAAMSGTDVFSYAAPVSVKTASSSRVIGETELKSLPLKKKQARMITNPF